MWCDVRIRTGLYTSSQILDTLRLIIYDSSVAYKRQHIYKNGFCSGLVVVTKETTIGGGIAAP